MDIRKIVTFVEEIHSEYGARANPPVHLREGLDLEDAHALSAPGA